MILGQIYALHSHDTENGMLLRTAAFRTASQLTIDA